jgi:hypothetical protein
MKRPFTISPADFTDGEWVELYNASTLMPRTYEVREKAKPFNRSHGVIAIAIDCCVAKAERILDGELDPENHAGENEEWASELRDVATKLSHLIGDIESCPKCGAQVALALAHEDEGEGEEAGRTFYYCSEHCRETH